MGWCWGYKARAGRGQFLGVFWHCILFANLIAGVIPTAVSHSDAPEAEYRFIDYTGESIMARFGSMKSAVLALASAALAKGQVPPTPTTSLADGLKTTGALSSTTANLATTTISGTATTYSVAFTVPASADEGPNILPNIHNSSAVQAQEVCPGYKASDVEKTNTGFTAKLSLAGDACNAYGTDIETLKLCVDVQTADRLSVNIKPMYLSSANESHYVLPADLVQLPEAGTKASDALDIDLQFGWSNDPTFAFWVLRKSTGDVLFDTRGSVLVYENQFIEFVTQLPENYNLYGMGERIHDLRLGNNFTATFFAADAGDPIDGNIYGNHPFYLDTRYYEVDEETGKHTLITNQNTSANNNYIGMSHGVYQRSAHPMEALMLPTNVTWRALGGSIDLYFFDGPNQAEVTKQYQTGAIGLPAMMSYWGFGFHQCRWGYRNWTETEDVVIRYREAGIPLEVIWNDIDYMFQYRDFTQDPNTFSVEVGKPFFERLAANNQHYIPIVDSAIYIPNPNNASDAYSIYTDGNDVDAFMLNPDGSQYIGSVWPGYTVFPDWMTDTAGPWWTRSMQSHYNDIPWSGIWIDMSEVSSFCVGSCGSGNLSLNPVHPPFSLPGEPGNLVLAYPEGFNLTNATEAAAASSAAASSASAASAASAASPPSTATIPYFTPEITPGERNVINPPYVINNVNGALGVHAVSPNATHHNGMQEYDVHNLFGTQILNATYNAILEVIPGKRPFIIGRSTFAGSGKYAGHWGGDNASLFAYMYFSISQALNFALFGMPMFGVDTCGFNGNSDEELCNRWMQLSAFFTFYRNHNVLAAIPQEAYVWESVAEASKKAMAIRYSLLPYIYTLFYQAHSTGSTVLRALSWEFPNDPSLANIDNQFLLGPNLMIVPVLGQGLTSRGGVFPGAGQGEIWYDWYTQAAFDAKPGVNHTIDAPLGHIPVYVRGGGILPQQEALYTTAESRNSSWSLIAALNADGAATGSIYRDDGESLNPESSLLVDLTVSNGSLYASSYGQYQDSNKLANVTILGVQSKPSTVSLNGVQLGAGNGSSSSPSVSYNSTSKVVSIKGLGCLTPNGAWAQDWTLSWS